MDNFNPVQYSYNSSKGYIDFFRQASFSNENTSLYKDKPNDSVLPPYFYTHDDRSSSSIIVSTSSNASDLDPPKTVSLPSSPLTQINLQSNKYRTPSNMELPIDGFLPATPPMRLKNVRKAPKIQFMSNTNNTSCVKQDNLDKSFDSNLFGQNKVGISSNKQPINSLYCIYCGVRLLSLHSDNVQKFCYSCGGQLSSSFGLNEEGIASPIAPGDVSDIIPLNSESVVANKYAEDILKNIQRQKYFTDPLGLSPNTAAAVRDVVLKPTHKDFFDISLTPNRNIKKVDIESQTTLTSEHLAFIDELENINITQINDSDSKISSDQRLLMMTLMKLSDAAILSKNADPKNHCCKHDIELNSAQQEIKALQDKLLAAAATEAELRRNIFRLEEKLSHLKSKHDEDVRKAISGFKEKVSKEKNEKLKNECSVRVAWDELMQKINQIYIKQL